MSGRRTKTLRRELISLLGRAPLPRGGRFMANGRFVVAEVDEFRSFKKVYQASRRSA